MKAHTTDALSSRDLVTNSQHAQLMWPDLASMIKPLESNSAADLAVNIKDFVDRQRTTPTNKELRIQSHILAALASQFHTRAQTLTDGVARGISSLQNGEPLILIAHQPNLFPSLGVFCPIILLNVVSTILEQQSGQTSAQMFLIVDYDVASDARFSVAHFPDIFRKTGSLSLSIPIAKHNQRQPMWLTEKPSDDVLERWANDLTTTVKQLTAYLAQGTGVSRAYGTAVATNLEAVNDVIRDLSKRATTLAEFNAYLISYIVNVVWGQPTCFITGHELQPFMIAGYQWVVDKSREIYKLANEATERLMRNGFDCHLKFRDPNELQMWYLCHKCAGRMSMFTSGTDVSTDGACVAQMPESCPSRSVRVPRVEPLKMNLLPRVLSDNILDLLVLGKIGGTSYIGGAEHLLVSNYVAAGLGLEPAPQIAFRPIGLYCGLTELGIVAAKEGRGAQPKSELVALDRSYFGKASILYYWISMGLENLHSTWTEYFKGGGLVHQANYRSVGFSPYCDQELASELMKLPSKVLDS